MLTLVIEADPLLVPHWPALRLDVLAALRELSVRKVNLDVSLCRL